MRKDRKYLGNIFLIYCHVSKPNVTLSLLIMLSFGIFNSILTILPYKSNPKNSVNVTENIVFIVKSNL
jgi:hypothetical protein